MARQARTRPANKMATRERLIVAIMLHGNGAECQWSVVSHQLSVVIDGRLRKLATGRITNSTISRLRCILFWNETRWLDHNGAEQWGERFAPGAGIAGGAEGAGESARGGRADGCAGAA